MAEQRISTEDLKIVREQLEARRDGFKTAWPAPIILNEMAIIEGLLQRLPTVENKGDGQS